MANELTTIRVYKKDKNTLLQKFNGPAHEAFRRAMAKTCTHPEEKRTYVMAELPTAGEEAITENGERRSIGGFYCKECHLYVFRQAAALPEQAGA